MDISQDDVLSALALGLRGDDALWLVADVDRTFTSERFFDRNLDFDEDDALLLLALDNDGLGGFGTRSLFFDDDFGRFGGFGTRSLFFDDDFGRFGGFGTRSLIFDDDFDDLFFDDDFDVFDFDDDFFDVSGSLSASRSLQRSVDLDEDDVLAALALGGGFGGIDLEDIADIEVSSSSILERERDIDLDEDDVLLWLALD